MTEQQAKQMLRTLSFKLGVSPRLISTRLLSADDKKDILNGHLSAEQLASHVRAWMISGLPDYANGHRSPMRSDLLKPYETIIKSFSQCTAKI